MIYNRESEAALAGDDGELSQRKGKIAGCLSDPSRLFGLLSPLSGEIPPLQPPILRAI